MGRLIPHPSRKLQIVGLVAYTIALAVYLSYTASDQAAGNRGKIEDNLLRVPVENHSLNNIEKPSLVIEEVTLIKASNRDLLVVILSRVLIALERKLTDTSGR